MKEKKIEIQLTEEELQLLAAMMEDPNPFLWHGESCAAWDMNNAIELGKRIIATNNHVKGHAKKPLPFKILE